MLKNKNASVGQGFCNKLLTVLFIIQFYFCFNLKKTGKDQNKQAVLSL